MNSERNDTAIPHTSTQAEKDTATSVRLLGTKRYGVFWFSSLLSNIGTWMQSVAEPWLVLSISGSSFLLGLDAFATNAPFWLLTLWGGALADHRDRGKIIYFFQGIQMMCPIVILSLVGTGAIKVWIIIFLSLIVGITDALSMPAFSSLIPSIVGKRDLGRALALNAIQFNLSRVLGPAIAGFVMMKYGVMWCFGANAVSYAPFFLSIYWLYPLARRRPRPQDDGRLDPLAVAKAILSDPVMGWPLLSVFTTAFFCSPLITFSPVIVKETLHAGAGEFGGAVTAFGIGGLIGPAVIFMTLRVSPLVVSLAAALLYAVAMTTSPLINSLGGMVSLLVTGGLLMTVANTAGNTFLQSRATNDNRGQTASLFMLAMRGGMALGNLATGAAASMISVQHALCVDGVVAAALQALIAWRVWKLRKPSP